MGVSLSINKDGYFRIRFRVSNRLILFFNKTYISKSLQTKNRKDAKLKLNYMYYKYKQLLDASYILPNDLLQELVDEFVQNELKQKVSTSFTYNSKKYKVVSNSITMLDAYDKFSFWYNNQNVTTKQYVLTTSKLKRIILPYFGETTHLIDITLESVEEFREFLSTFPNINKQRYKQLTFNQITNLKKVPSEDFITVNTQIKYLKILKQFFHYTIKANLLNYNPCILLNIPNKNILNREPFEYDEILELFDIFETLDSKRYIYYSLVYTGMRPSEFWKCKISVDEAGVIYFDLSDKNILRGLLIIW